MRAGVLTEVMGVENSIAALAGDVLDDLFGERALETKIW